MQANHHRVRTTSFGGIVLATTALATTALPTAGCSSPLTTVALREFLRESTMTLALDSEAEESAKPADDSQASDGPDAVVADAGSDRDRDSDGDQDDAARDLPLEQRIERSLDRLARTTGLDPIARDVLVDTLDKAAKDDWPDIIDSFTSSLETSSARSSPSVSVAAAGGEASTDRAVKPVGGLTIPVAATASAPDQAVVTNPSAGGVEASVIQETRHEEPAAAEPVSVAAEAAEETEPPEDPRELVAMLKERLAEARRNAPLAVRRACFASKVRGWGNLDAFDDPRFVPGQDVLVYVELDNLDGVEMPKGYSTRVEARLRLRDASDAVVGEWSFPLVEDRADSPRTDYFVRYVVRIPANATAGPHRLEAAITDAVSSKTVATDLTCEIVAEAGVPAR